MKNNTPFKLHYLTMPDSLYKESRISLTAMKVYLFVNAYTNPFFFSNDHLAEMFGCTPQQVSDAITKLEELKYVRCEYKTKSGGGKFRLVINDYSDKSSTTSRVKKVEPTTSHQRLDKEDKDNNIKENFFEKTSREQRPLKRSSSFTTKPYYPKFPEKKKRIYVDGTHII